MFGYFSLASPAAQHGVTQGIANTLGYALEQTGYSYKIANISKETLYYVGCSMLSFYRHYTQNQEVASATYQAVAHTGAFLFTNTLFYGIAECSSRLAQKAHKAGWIKTGEALGVVSNYTDYGRYAYDAYVYGITDTAMWVIVGDAAEEVTETAGVAGADMLFAYGAMRRRGREAKPEQEGKINPPLVRR